MRLLLCLQDFDATCSSSDDLGSEYIDFAGSDSLLTAAEYQAYPDLQMLPTVRGYLLERRNRLGLPVLNTYSWSPQTHGQALAVG